MTAPETPKIIIPTIGRRVWYFPAAHDDTNDHGDMRQLNGGNGDKHFDAGIVYVWDCRMVNLDVTDHSGRHHQRTSVPLLQEGDPIPTAGGYAAWMPYQAAQNAKAAAPAASPAAPLPGDAYVYPTRREEALHALVSGAAVTIAAASHTGNASLIADNILAVVNKLHPQEVTTDTAAYVEQAFQASVAFSSAAMNGPAPTLIIGDTAYPDGTTATGVAPLPALSPAQQDLEAEIQAKADNAPRVTPQDLQDEIASVHFFTAAEGCSGRSNGYILPDGFVPSLNLLTICVLVLQNGFTVIGHSACASPENCNKEIGERIARENAERNVWPLLGFRLRDELSRTPLTDADAAADLAGTPRPA